MIYKTKHILYGPTGKNLLEGNLVSVNPQHFFTPPYSSDKYVRINFDTKISLLKNHIADTHVFSVALKALTPLNFERWFDDL